MTLTHEHVQHLAKRNSSLHAKVEKLKAKGATLTKHGVHLLEVTAGAALGGLLQGMMKDPHLFRVPVDLGLGIGLNLAAALDVAGSEWSPHLANLGTGFLAAFATDKGFAVGTRKKTSGSFFGHGGPVGALPAGAPAAVHGEISPQQMAANLIQRMQAGG